MCLMLLDLVFRWLRSMEESTISCLDHEAFWLISIYFVTGEEVMHQRCTTLNERGTSDADLFQALERLSEEPKRDLLIFFVY
jgi:hypothetical protein